MQGSGGIVATDLSAGITDAVLIIPVDSTEGFPPAAASVEQRVIWIGNERIAYTAITTGPDTFTGATRGFGDSDAAAHLINERVYTSQGSYVNRAMDYNIAVITDASGIWAAVAIPLATLKIFGLFFTVNFAFLGSDMAFLTYIWAAMGIGGLVSFGLALAGGRRV